MPPNQTTSNDQANVKKQLTTATLSVLAERRLLDPVLEERRTVAFDCGLS